MSQYLGRRPPVVRANQFSHHPSKRQFFSQDQHNRVRRLDAFQSISIKSVNKFKKKRIN